MWSLVKSSGVDINVRLEITQFFPVLVVVQRTEALIAVQTRVHRSKSVVRRDPPEGSVKRDDSETQTPTLFNSSDYIAFKLANTFIIIIIHV